MADPLLSVSGLQKSFGEHRVLDGVSIDVPQGEIVGLLGPNGSGKSTLLNIISGFLPANAGSIVFDGKDVTRMPVHGVSRAGLVRTFQLPSMPQRMTVSEVLYAGAVEGSGISGIFMKGNDDSAEVERLIDRLALEAVRDLPASSLSGGQKKLLSIALVMRTRPKMLCLDEPTAGVHPTLRHHMVGMLRQANAAGVTLMIVEHDMHFIHELCQRCVVLDRGSVIADCPPELLKSNESVVEAYLGSARDKRAHL